MDPLLILLKRLADAGIEFVVIGGMAATAHGSSVVTLDVDVCTHVNEALGKRVIECVQDLHPRWRMRPDLPEITPDDRNLVGIKNIYLTTDLGPLDILGELPGICGYDELKHRSEWTYLAGGLRLRVVNLDTLIAAKRAANRPKDQLAIRELEIIRQSTRHQPGLFDKPASE